MDCNGPWQYLPLHPFQRSCASPAARDSSPASSSSSTRTCSGSCKHWACGADRRATRSSTRAVRCRRSSSSPRSCGGVRAPSLKTRERPATWPPPALLIGLRCSNLSGVGAVYKTAWEVKQRAIIDLAADRGAFIDQSQSLNLFLSEPTFEQVCSLC